MSEDDFRRKVIDILKEMLEGLNAPAKESASYQVWALEAELNADQIEQAERDGGNLG